MKHLPAALLAVPPFTACGSGEKEEENETADTTAAPTTTAVASEPLVGAHRDRSARGVRNTRTQQTNQGKMQDAKKRKRQEAARVARASEVVTRKLTAEELEALKRR
mgnify:CR=1 FL=1|jgi:hypothetical protein